jgi:hypothetical protein
VKEGNPLYLSPDTLAQLTARDLLRGAAYKRVKNGVVALVRRDKLLSNLSKLSASKNLPTVLWEIAKAAIGKPRPPLPNSVKNSDGNDMCGGD